MSYSRMALALPFEFDSSRTVKMILRGSILFLALVVGPGILYGLLVSHSPATVFSLTLSGVILLYFVRKVHQNIEGCRGVITATYLEIQPGSVLGLPLKGPTGRFPIQQFRAVIIVQVSASIESYGPAQERVHLVGPGGVPDVLIARADRGAGKALGEALATALGLELEEKTAAY